MKQMKTQNLYNFWNALRNGRIAPYRSEIDPRTIASYLDSTFILELVDDNKMRFRLAGTQLCDAYGMELRGMSGYCLWQEDCREKIKQLTMDVLHTPAVGIAQCTVETQAGALLEAEFLFMPLRSDFGAIDRILGCVFYTTSDGKQLTEVSPMHHWVDFVESIPVDVQVVDEATGQSARIQERCGVSHLRRRAPRSVNNGRQNFPCLRAIQGGITKFKHPGRASTDANRVERQHLKLVKSDVS